MGGASRYDSLRRDSFMAFAWRYASRSIWRNKRRTALSIGTVALSVAVSTISLRYSKALLTIWQTGSIDHGNGHAQLHVQGFLERPDVITGAHTFKDGHGIETRLANDPAVEAVTRRINFEGMVSAGAKAVYFLGRAVTADSELKVAPAVFDAEGDRGTFLTSDKPNGVVIGKGLAEILEVDVGDEVSVLASTVNGTVNGIDAVVVGVINPPIPALSKRLLYAPIARVQEGLEMSGAYTEIAVRLKTGVVPETWVEGLKPEATAMGLDLRGWWDLDPVIRRFEKIWDSIVGVITGLLFLSAAISVLNIVYMMVAERTVEIGTLMAIGARARDVRRLFTLEAGVIGLFGGAVGSVVANLALAAMFALGVTFESPFGSGVLVVHPTPSLGASLVVTGLGMIICAVAALAPARKAARVEPVVAFRGQIT